MGKYQEASDRTPQYSNDSYIDQWVRVGKSIFVTGEKGLFANRRFNNGDVIQELKGKIISDENAEKLSECQDYLFDVKDKNKIYHVINVCDAATASAARYVNSVRHFMNKKRNAEFKQYNKHIYLVASRNISKGTEILSYYGEDTLKLIDK